MAVCLFLLLQVLIYTPAIITIAAGIVPAATERQMYLTKAMHLQSGTSMPGGSSRIPDDQDS